MKSPAIPSTLVNYLIQHKLFQDYLLYYDDDHHHSDGGLGAATQEHICAIQNRLENTLNHDDLIATNRSKQSIVFLLCWNKKKLKIIILLKANTEREKERE